MRALLTIWQTLLTIALLVLALGAQGQERVALVIGNSAYKVGALRNPANDARAMAKVLRETGFDVMHGEDLSHRRMFEAVRDFGRKLAPGVVAVFYYAGHGLQVRDRNFLIPIEADVQTEEEIPYTSVDVSFLLDVMNRAKSRVNIVILDACRNNPFARSFRSASSGLAQMEAPSGTLIAYATAPGRVASDGAGEHGLYTEQLLKVLATPGLPVEIVFKRVRESVERLTKSRQIPWESSSLKGDFSFVPAVAAAPKPLPAPALGPSESAAFELAFWDSIKASSQVADYQAYLNQYPNGRFAVLARARIANQSPRTPPAANPVPPAQVAAAAPTPIAASGQPAVGEKWTYRYTDLWRPDAKVEVTHVILGVTTSTIAERLSATARGRVLDGVVEQPTGLEIREWKLGELSLREFAPFALALNGLDPGTAIPEFRTSILQDAGPVDWLVSGQVTREEIAVPAGRFKAIKVVLEGRSLAISQNRGITSFHLTVWYAPQSKRYVKAAFASYERTASSTNSLHHNEVYELVSGPG